IADSQGVLVRDLTSDNSPAARAGLQSGDVVTSINGQKVKNTRDLIRRIASLPVGSTANITYIRAGEQRTAAVKLEERQDESDEQPEIRPVPLTPRGQRGAPEKSERSDRVKPKQTLGINTRTLTPDLAKLQGLEGARGAFVTGVDPGSIADDNGLLADDLIVEFNNLRVSTHEDFLRIIKDIKSGDDVVIRVLRKERGVLRSSRIISFTMP
ncbi:MAG TPA: PDZ domain-containing protein, partial [Blastocatellia bacterium]|nr:PDZ domain-containing protein [Blastocatellia bacterium]